MKFELRNSTLEEKDSSIFSNLFEAIRPSIEPTYKYKQGNCHNLAHYVSLQLVKAGVAHKKIWIYAPSRILADSKIPLSLLDVNQLSPTGMLTWGYHVALWIEHGDKAVIFDFMLDETKPLSLSEWLAVFGLATYKIDIQDADKYLFYGIKCESKKTTLFSGNYFPYEGVCQEQAWIAKGLAVNETAYEFFMQEQEHFLNDTDLSEAYRLMVGRVINFECVFRDFSTNKRMTQSFQRKHHQIIEKYRKVYAEKLEKWQIRLNAILNPS